MDLAPRRRARWLDRQRPLSRGGHASTFIVGSWTPGTVTPVSVATREALTVGPSPAVAGSGWGPPRRHVTPRAAGPLGAAALLAMLLRLPYLGLPLGVDEGGLAYVAQHWTVGGGVLYGSSWLDRPPLLVALFKFALVGGDTGVRMLGAAASIAFVVTVATIGARIGGDGVAGTAGLLGALFGASVALGSVFTPGELLAAVPASLSVACLVSVKGRRATAFLFGAGLFAVCAVLVKQSFLDAGVAGVAFLAASWITGRRRWAWPAAYAAGALVPLLAVVLWQARAGLPAGSLPYALVGFRLDALRVLATSDLSLPLRAVKLVPAALGSGLLLAAPAAVAGLRRLRADAVVAATMAAWLGAGLVGVAAGGSYWPHYLIQVAGPCSVLAAVGLAAKPRTMRRRTTALISLVAIVVTGVGGAVVQRSAPYRAERLVGRYVAAHARPGDTQYVLYARANAGYYTGLPSPYPYAWSLMVRVVPGARARLERLLASSRRPTWIIEWQRPDRWQLDPRGAVARALVTRYRLVATVCGHPVLVRRERQPPGPPPVVACPKASS